MRGRRIGRRWRAGLDTLENGDRPRIEATLVESLR